MKTVLVVEDEFATAELLEAVLADGGYRVLTAANGRHGLQLLAEGPRPDLVLADFMMPILDGPGMVRAMRESEAHRDIPVIMMSALSEDAIRRHVDGYAAFVRKPFRVLAVLRLIASILASRDGPNPGV